MGVAHITSKRQSSLGCPGSEPKSTRFRRFLNLAAVRREQNAPKCSVCALGDLCFAKGLKQSALARLDDLLIRSGPIIKGAHLFWIGDPFKAFFAVQKGCFKTYSVDAAGREHVLGFHLPGDLIGLDALHAGNYRCSALALEPSSVCILGCRDLGELSERVPGLHERLISLMSRDLSNAQIFAGHLSAEERLAAFLLDLSARLQWRGLPADVITLSMPRRDIGNYLGVATETVSRVFTQFKNDGLIDLRREKVHLLDEERLTDIALLVPAFSS